jgi:hypothetical protein
VLVESVHTIANSVKKRVSISDAPTVLVETLVTVSVIAENDTVSI